MAARNTEVKAQALAMIEAGRHEITAEAGWLRHELNVKHLTKSFVSHHAMAVLAASFCLGLVLPSILLPKRHEKGKHARTPPAGPSMAQDQRNENPPVQRKSLLASLLKMATPLILKEGARILKSYAARPQVVSAEPV